MANRSHPRILVVDDEAIIRESLAEFLSANQLTVSTAADGKQGIELAQKERFDVVLCDVNMPGLDGLDVLDHIGR
jgi:two-component system, NtrC family, nitrogen regulation response regulator NtrX